MNRISGPALLLIWAAKRGSGPISQLEQVIASHLRRELQESKVESSRQVVFELESLGYLRLDWSKSSWEAKPMSIHNLPGNQGLALLTGCRPYSVKKEIEDAGLAEVKLRPSSDSRKSAYLPETTLLAFDSYKHLASAAAMLRIPYLGDIYGEESYELSELPVPVDESPGPNLSGAPIERFDDFTLRFSRTESFSSEGLYRQRSNGPARYWARAQGKWFGTSRSSGQWLQLYQSARRVLNWAPSENGKVGKLIVPVSLSLTGELAELVQGCSGVLPTRTGSLLHYENVPKNLALEISQALRQDDLT